MPNSRYKNPQGYIMIYKPDHPRPWYGYVQEHILVMEEHLGILLPEGAVVHHRNRVRDDNRIENLLLMRSDSDHVMLHVYLKAKNELMIKAYEDWSLEMMKNIKSGMSYAEASSKPMPKILSSPQPSEIKFQAAKPKTILRKKTGT